MVLVILANGFEDAETFVPIDILRRGGVEVRLISTEITAEVKSKYGITIFANYQVDNIFPSKRDTILIPGGSDAVNSILANRNAMNFIAKGITENSSYAAICAGPTVLAAIGILDGKNATCYPGCEPDMAKAVCHCDKPLCIEEKIITARAAGSSFDFGFAILESIKGKAEADKIRADMYF